MTLMELKHKIDEMLMDPNGPSKYDEVVIEMPQDDQKPVFRPVGHVLHKIYQEEYEEHVIIISV